MAMNPRLLRPLATGFDLRRLSGLVQWYDAADQSTMTLNGTTVSEWRSKVGGVAVSQGTAAAQPTLTTGYYNGRSALTFDGGDVLANLSLPIQINGMTVAVVFDEATRVAFAGLVSATPASGNDSNQTDGFRMSVHEGTNRPCELLCAVANNLDLRSPLVPETTALGKRVAISYASPSAGGSGSGFTRFDGTPGAEDTLYGAAGDSTGTLIGGRFLSGAVSALYRFNGRICEVAIWDRALTVDETQKVEGYLAWRWGLQGQLPTNHPYAYSFPGLGSQPQPSNSEAQDWINAVYAAGSSVNTATAKAVDDFVSGCKADGIWSAIKACCVLCGPNTLAGALVPLVGTAPTNNNFVSGDYNRETGLVGNGSTKYLDSNRANNADPQDSFHTAVYLSTISDVYVAAAGPSGSGMMTLSTTAARNRSGTAVSFSSTATAPTLVGHSRADASTVSVIANGTVASGANASNTPGSGNILLPGYIYLPLYSSNRIAFYSIGESLDLAALDTRVSALIAAIGAAI